MTVPPDLDRRARALFEELVEIEDREERARLLKERCGGEVDLRNRVTKLLTVKVEERFLAKPAVEELVAARDRTAEQAIRRLVGRTIDEYEIVRHVGTGGMGEVYAARHRRTGLAVGFKVVRSGMEREDVLRRFDRERDILAHLSHPGIARIYDMGTLPDDGRPYFVMELVRDALPITDYCDKRSLKTDDRLRLFREVCRAIHHAHLNGVIHRDLKPSNILVSEVDETVFVKVIDFGIATFRPEANRGLATLSGFGPIGTLAYMSPEQMECDRPRIDARADVYALGSLLYELLVGDVPFGHERFRAASLGEILDLVRSSDPPSPSTVLAASDGHGEAVAELRCTDIAALRGKLAGDLDLVVMKAIARRHEDRYESVAQFGRYVDLVLSGEAVPLAPPSVLRFVRRFARRHRAASVAAVVAAGSILLGVVGLAVGLHQARASLARVESSHRLLNDLFQSDPATLADDRGTVEATDLLDNWAGTIFESDIEEPDLLANLHASMANLYGALGSRSKQEPHLRAALALRKSTFGEEDRRTLVAVVDLGRLLSNIGHRGEANALAVPAARVATRTLAPDDWVRGQLLLMSAWSEPDDAEAEALLADLIAFQMATLGPANAETLLARKQWLQKVVALGRHDEADAGYRALIADWEHSDPASSWLCATMSDFAWALRNRGHLDEAESFHRRALDCRRTLVGQRHAETFASMHGLANVLHARWRVDPAAVSPISDELCAKEARELWEDAIAGITDAPAYLGAFELAFGRFLSELGQFEEAERRLRAGITRLEQHADPQFSYRIRGYEFLAEHFERIGDDEEALAWRARHDEAKRAGGAAAGD